MIRTRAAILSQSLAPRDESINLLHPYIVMVLLAFMQCGLVEVKRESLLGEYSISKQSFALCRF